MKFENRLTSCSATGLLGLAVLLSSGCATLPSFGGRAPVKTEQKYSPDADMYVVDIHPAHGQPTRWEGPILKGMTVQSALEASGALGKIRNADVEVIRPVPENGTVLRMPADLQPNKRLVKYEQDYAILPGDRIVVKPAQTQNALEKLLGNLK